MIFWYTSKILLKWCNFINKHSLKLNYCTWTSVHFHIWQHNTQSLMICHISFQLGNDNARVTTLPPNSLLWGKLTHILIKKQILWQALWCFSVWFISYKTTPLWTVPMQTMYGEEGSCHSWEFKGSCSGRNCLHGKFPGRGRVICGDQFKYWWIISLWASHAICSGSLMSFTNWFYCSISAFNNSHTR